ncbi:Signal transducer regulating beta-lactamase production, contains metallopeptidase domain [Dyadobacter koreensis]|uniref:Signal transducer regulating beta-lactamase production, contains metallopeptidase domain n=1 Tax=Dyadobacter koreensis TaxID=408657 RepID=A0A1H6ZVP3_9BACT|nr:M56 family metallopeptidase [Dyadobacter koreensis]SEJ57553.1 Signal transducer regulating beta-lactamase production, contains metallopeptidase domain [Dyadobacter koreensis]
MKSFFNLFSDALVSSFGWMLVHSLWQGALLVLVASIALYLLRKSPATVRYTVGILTLSTQVISSLVTFFYYYFNAAPKVLSTALKNTAHNVSDWKTLTYELSLTSKVQLWLATHIQELVICWLIGAAVLVARFLGGWIYTEYLRHNARLVMNKEWRARFGVLTAKLKVYQSIELKESSKILTPMVIGTLQPVVLIPIGLLLGFPTAQIEAILAHELAHIRRHDYLINMLQSFVEVVFFFHPALWWLSERVRVEREHCCDDLAIEACGDRLSLAHALVGIAEFKTNHSLAVAFASKKPLLLQRVKRVLGVAPKSARIFGGLPVTMLFVAALIGVSVYAVGQDTIKKKKAKAKTHQVASRQSKYVTVRDEYRTVVDAEQEINTEIPEIDENINVNINEDFDGSDFLLMNDSLKSKMNEFHQKMAVLQKQMEPLQSRMHELQLEMEKRQFEMEHFDRDREKIDWKKDNANEIRQGLLEKRSNLLHPDIKSKTKLNEAELEKQLADFEQQIKAQEQVITKLNADLANNLKEGEKAGEPYRDMEKEMDQLSGKMDEIGKDMGLASLGIEKLYPAPPRPARAPKAPKMKSKPAVAAPAAPAAPALSPKTPPAPPSPARR